MHERRVHEYTAAKVLPWLSERKLLPTTTKIFTRAEQLAVLPFLLSCRNKMSKEGHTSWRLWSMEGSMIVMELTSLSATMIARAIRTKLFSSADVVDAHLSRLEAVNPQLNAVVQLSASSAAARSWGDLAG